MCADSDTDCICVDSGGLVEDSTFAPQILSEMDGFMESERVIRGRRKITRDEVI